MTQSFTLFEGVAWDPAISTSATPMIHSQARVGNRRVLDLFSGPGAISVLIAIETPKQVLSLAEDNVSEACTRYNVAAHEFDSIVKVQRLDPTAETALPDSEQFALIFASLSQRNDHPISPNRRIELLLHCVNHNLEVGGQAFVICEPGDMTEALRTACEAEKKTLVDTAKGPTLWKVFEIKSTSSAPTTSGDLKP